MCRSLAGELYVIPKLLVATQINCEVSEELAFEIVTAPGLGMLIFGLDESTSFQSLSQDITGSGFPVASHSNVALPPVTTRLDLGFLVSLGYPGGGLRATDIFREKSCFNSYDPISYG